MSFTRDISSYTEPKGSCENFQVVGNLPDEFMLGLFQFTLKYLNSLQGTLVSIYLAWIPTHNEDNVFTGRFETRPVIELADGRPEHSLVAQLEKTKKSEEDVPIFRSDVTFGEKKDSPNSRQFYTLPRNPSHGSPNTIFEAPTAAMLKIGVMLKSDKPDRIRKSWISYFEEAEKMLRSTIKKNIQPMTKKIESKVSILSQSQYNLENDSKSLQEDDKTIFDHLDVHEDYHKKLLERQEPPEKKGEDQRIKHEEDKKRQDEEDKRNKYEEEANKREEKT